MLTCDRYLTDDIGRVTGAIAGWANTTYNNSLSEFEQPLARRILTRLIHYGSTSKTDKDSVGIPDTRRPVSFNELISNKDESFVVHSLIEKLANARLLVTDGDTVEIIHDALIARWKSLGEWIDQERSFLLWRQQVDDSLTEWQEEGQKEGNLLYGAHLGEAEGYLNSRNEDLNENERRYIKASQKKRDRQRSIIIRKMQKTLVLRVIKILITLRYTLGKG